MNGLTAPGGPEAEIWQGSPPLGIDRCKGFFGVVAEAGMAVCGLDFGTFGAVGVGLAIEAGRRYGG